MKELISEATILLGRRHLFTEGRWVPSQQGHSSWMGAGEPGSCSKCVHLSLEIFTVNGAGSPQDPRGWGEKQKKTKTKFAKEMQHHWQKVDRVFPQNRWLQLSLSCVEITKDLGGQVSPHL